MSLLTRAVLDAGIVIEPLFNAFATAAFFEFVIFAIFEMRYLLSIWRARRCAWSLYSLSCCSRTMPGSACSSCSPLYRQAKRWGATCAPWLCAGPLADHTVAVRLTWDLLQVRSRCVGPAAGAECTVCALLWGPHRRPGADLPQPAVRCQLPALALACSGLTVKAARLASSSQLCASAAAAGCLCD